MNRARSGEPAIRLFGPPSVRVAGGWEPLRPGKTSALVAYVTHRSAPVRRSELAALLWPELDEQRAHTNLRQLLRGLANGALCDCIERDRDSVRAAVVSDAVAFERALDDARWSEAVALYQGPLLEGFDELDAGEFTSWLASERTVAEGRWRHACLALLEADGGEDGAGHALQLADRMLRVDPLDEVALRHAMQAAAAIGDTVAVRQRFDAFRLALDAEVGVEPEPATIALAEQLSALASSGSGTRFGSAQKRPAIVAVAAGGRPPLPRAPGRRRVIGRSDAVRRLVALVERDDVRVVTLLAPGGMGKTTLAIALAEALEPGFPDGVAFAALEDVQGEALVPALAHALGLVLNPAAPPLDQVIAALAPKSMLLVLDAFEHHHDQVAVLDALVRGCPRLTLIATTRSRLRLSTEVVFEVPPLDTADGDAGEATERTPSAAARLFLRVAARNGVRLEPTTEELECIERVCRLVGGSPLAIELVAAWTDVLSLREVEGQVVSSWDLLRSDDVDRGDRHGDLEATLAATWKHLPSDDRDAWARVAVLPGSLDRTLAATVAGTGWRGLRRLVDGALLARHGDRLEMHALVARFGRERARDEGLDEAAWEAAVGVWLERASLEPGRVPRSRQTWHEHDLDQAAAAWRWTIARGRLDDAAALAVGLLRGLGRTGRRREQAAAASEAVRALEAGGAVGRQRDLALARTLPFVRGTPEDAAAAAARALALAEALDDDVALGAALAGMARAEPTVDAAERFARAREAFERTGDDVGWLDLALYRADLLVACGRLDEGEALAREAASRADRVGDGIASAQASDVEATIALLRGDLTGASERVASARTRFEAEGSAYRGSGTLATEAWLALVASDRAEAERRVEAYVASERRYRDARVVAAAMRSALHARYGEHDGVVVEARTVLERVGEQARPSVLRFFAHQRLARALAGLGEPSHAAAHLRHALDMARAFDAPRFVVRVALSAGALALACDRPDEAAAVLTQAAHHPRFEAALSADLHALCAEAGADVDASATPRIDDAALLAHVERLLDDVAAPR